MPLDNRDWYREEPSKEWNANRGRRGAHSDPSEEVREHTKRLRYRPLTPSRLSAGSESRRRRRTFGQWSRRTAAVITVSVVAVVAWEHRTEIDAAVRDAISLISRDQTGIPRLTPGLPTASSDERIVRLNAKPGLDVPARTVTKWWIEDPRFGRVTVHVPVGTTPREALTVALAERGFQAVR